MVTGPVLVNSAVLALIKTINQKKKMRRATLKLKPKTESHCLFSLQPVIIILFFYFLGGGGGLFSLFLTLT